MDPTLIAAIALGLGIGNTISIWAIIIAAKYVVKVLREDAP